MIQPLWKAVWYFPKKLSVKFPCDPEIPFLDIYPKELKAGCQTYLEMHVPSTTIHNNCLLDKEF